MIFPNFDGLVTEEIKEIFSKFGNVITVKVSGTGYRFFVRLEESNGAQKAVDSLKNHSTIKLLPRRKKKQEQ